MKVAVVTLFAKVFLRPLLSIPSMGGGELFQSRSLPSNSLLRQTTSSASNLSSVFKTISHLLVLQVAISKYLFSLNETFSVTTMLRLFFYCLLFPCRHIVPFFFSHFFTSFNLQLIGFSSSYSASVWVYCG